LRFDIAIRYGCYVECNPIVVNVFSNVCLNKLCKNNKIEVSIDNIFCKSCGEKTRTVYKKKDTVYIPHDPSDIQKKYNIEFEGVRINCKKIDLWGVNYMKYIIMQGTHNFEKTIIDKKKYIKKHQLDIKKLEKVYGPKNVKVCCGIVCF